jgi:hypothetical protein
MINSPHRVHRDFAASVKIYPAKTVTNSLRPVNMDNSEYSPAIKLMETPLPSPSDFWL